MSNPPSDTNFEFDNLDEKRLVIQWLVDKQTLDNNRSYLLENSNEFSEDLEDRFLLTKLALLNIKNEYNYLKWACEENNKLKKEKPKEKKDNLDFNIIWLDELKNYEEEDKEWIIDKLIPTKSVIILTGKRGTLKTFVTLLMAYSIASGNPFLEKFSTRKGGVIYLDKENGIGIMKKRTLMINEELKLDEKDLRIGFICFSQIKLDKLGGIAAIEKVIEEHHPRLLIVDTYRRSVSFDENDAGKVSELFVDTLRPLVERYDVSLLLIHHNRKGNRESTDEMDEMRGSSDLANYADIILKTERKSGNLILKQLKNRNAEEEKPIKIKVEFGENSDPYVKLTYEGEFVKQNRAERCVEMITLWLNSKGIRQFKTSEVKDIAFKSGVKETTFKIALKLMEDTGIIENIGFGLYKVSD